MLLSIISWSSFVLGQTRPRLAEKSRYMSTHAFQEADKKVGTRLILTMIKLSKLFDTPTVSGFKCESTLARQIRARASDFTLPCRDESDGESSRQKEGDAPDARATGFSFFTSFFLILSPSYGSSSRFTIPPLATLARLSFVLGVPVLVPLAYKEIKQTN